MGLAGTLAQNGVFYPTMRAELQQSSVRPTPLQKRAASFSPKYWTGWGGISPEFDQIEDGTLFYSALARDGVLHQGLEYETPFEWAEDWGPTTPFRPRKTQKRPTRPERLQAQWECERLERQREKERLGEREWAEARRKEMYRSEQAERNPLAEREVTRQQIEHHFLLMGMSIAQAKARYTPGPMANGAPDMSQWEHGVHAHPSLWLWED